MNNTLEDQREKCLKELSKLSNQLFNHKNSKNYEAALVISDLHIPFHDETAISLILDVAKDLNPDLIVLLGDILDCWEVSDFVKDPKLYDIARLPIELQEGRKFLSDLRTRFPAARIVYPFGNHEYRMHRYISTYAPSLAGLRGLSLPEQLDCDELDIETIDNGTKENEFLWGKLLMGHWDKISKHSSYTAKLLLQEKGISLIQAHSHRLGSHYKRIYNDVLAAYENGCLCDLNPPYKAKPNWQQGFSVVYKDTNSDLFHVVQYPIIQSDKDYRVFFRNKIYKKQ